MKKILATILALVLAIGVTTMAWATETAAEKVAKVGETEYATLQEAVNAADGKTVQLLQDVTASITIESGKTVTLDLNGKTLTNEDGKHTITNNGKLTIVDTSAAKSGKVDNVTHGKGAVVNYGVTVLNGGTFERSQEKGKYSPYGNGGNSWYTIANYGKMEINAGVTVYNNGGYSSMIRNGGEGPDASTLTINGGTFSGGINTVKNDDGASLVINDGHFSNVTQATVQNNNTAEIHGGTFDAAGHDAFQNRYYAGGKNNGVLTITAGQFTGDVYSEEGATTAISGGAFSSDVSAYAGSNAVASLKNVYYVGTDSIEAAVNSMSGGDTLTVIKGSVKVGNTEYGANQTYTKPTSYYYYSPSTTTPDTTKGSPKTFDAGVGIYAVTAVLSMTGMAWTAKKRH